MGKKIIINIIVFITIFFQIIKFTKSNESSYKKSKYKPTTTDLACSLNICSQKGGPCSKDSSASGFQCFDEDRCLNGTCVSSLQVGEVCKNSFDCTLGSTCIYIDEDNINHFPSNGTLLDYGGYSNNNNNNNTIEYRNSSNQGIVKKKLKKCLPSFFAEYGESCLRTTDCLNSLECIKGVCSTPHFGCISDLSCRNDSICDSRTNECVVTQLEENECFLFRSFSCKNIMPCALKSFNISSIGVCKNEIKEGDPCLTTKYTCNWNLEQYCKPLKPGSILGTCTTTPKNTLNTCISQTDCKYYEFCKCDSHSGVGYCTTRGSFVGRYCIAAVQLFLKCYKNTNCSDPFTNNPNSCVYRYCPEESKCLNTFCTFSMVPAPICISNTCNLQIFGTDLDSHQKAKFSKSISIYKPFFNLIIIIQFFLIFFFF